MTDSLNILTTQQVDRSSCVPLDSTVCVQAHVSESKNIDQRRRFLQQAGSLLGLTVCAASMSALLASCEQDQSKLVSVRGTVDLNVATESALANIGGAVKRTFSAYNNSKPVIIVRTSATSFLVVSAVCNHAGCIVSAPKSAGANIVCDFSDNKCGHSAEFSTATGLQVKGPGGGSATGGLTVIASSYNSGTNILTMSFV